MSPSKQFMTHLKGRHTHTCPYSLRLALAAACDLVRRVLWRSVRTGRRVSALSAFPLEIFRFRALSCHQLRTVSEVRALLGLVVAMAFGWRCLCTGRWRQRGSRRTPKNWRAAWTHGSAVVLTHTLRVRATWLMRSTFKRWACGS